MVIPGNPGVGQTPLAQPFQPGQTGIAPAEQEPREGQTQPSLAPAAESQESPAESLQSREAEERAPAVEQDDSSTDTTAERGSLVNIEV